MCAAKRKPREEQFDLFEALRLMEEEKGIPVAYMAEKIRTAIALAVRKDRAGCEDSVVELDPETGRFYVALRKTVAETVENPAAEIRLEEARGIRPDAAVGDTVDIPLDPKKFGRIAAQAAKHVIHQGICEAEKGLLLEEYQSRQHDIVSALVRRVDPVRGTVVLEIGNAEATLPKSEQMPDEVFREGQRVRVYVVDVQNGDRGPRLLISRTHPGLVKRLFEMNVPEIYDGTVEIRSISREAGSRSKMAVTSRERDVDPIGACIGPKGSRVSAIVDELGGEKIDLILYDEDPRAYVRAALSPAAVTDVVILDGTARSCRVIVPDQQLSLAIGNRGQNVRLAARLTGWKIDIRPESWEPPEEETAPENPEASGEPEPDPEAEAAEKAETAGDPEPDPETEAAEKAETAGDPETAPEAESGTETAGDPGTDPAAETEPETAGGGPDAAESAG